MFRLRMLCAVIASVAIVVSTAGVNASGRGRTLLVTMTNDADSNQIRVYDADTHELLQTLSTHGKGGVGGNARGIRQHEDRLVAVVNNGSNTVALFSRDGDVLRFDRIVPTTSAPVSVDFGNDHLYAAGTTTVDSFVLHGNAVERLDGTTDLTLAGGGFPAAGSTGQVGVIDEQQLLVTLKADPDPGTVDVISLDGGRITGSAPTAIPTPDGTLAPFGFATYPDGTAVITLAHSNQDGLFRNGAFGVCFFCVPIYSNQNKWFSRQTLCHRPLMRHHLHAWPAPRSPETHNNYPATIVTQPELVTVEIFTLDLRSHFANGQMLALI